MGGTGFDPESGGLSGWKAKDGHLAKTFLFPDFRTALDFVNRVGDAAEQQGHHPDICLAWGRVDVETWSHDAGGVTDRDYKLAAEIDRRYLTRAAQG